MGKLIPILLLLIGTGAGFGAGVMLAPPPAECPEADAETEQPVPDHCQPEEVPATDELDEAEEDTTEEVEYVRMNDQFVIPVMQDGVVRSLVVLSITIEVELGQAAAIYSIEPKLRDAFLRVLFDHANAGGFDGGYTEAARTEKLRRALLEKARKTAGSSVQNILILDLLRQDV